MATKSTRWPVKYNNLDIPGFENRMRRCVRQVVLRLPGHIWFSCDISWWSRDGEEINHPPRGPMKLLLLLGLVIALPFLVIGFVMACAYGAVFGAAASD